MRRILALVLSMVAGSLATPTTAQQTRRRPNVLFIAVDDLNDDLGTYRHPLVKSPNILQKHFRETHPNIVTLPQLFRKHGYVAARVGRAE